jgi:hypothetical protein
MTVRLRDIWQLCLVFLVLDVVLGPWLPWPFRDSPGEILDAAATRIAFCVVLSVMAWRDRRRAGSIPARWPSLGR